MTAHVGTEELDLNARAILSFFASGLFLVINITFMQSVYLKLTLRSRSLAWICCKSDLSCSSVTFPLSLPLVAS